MDFVHKKPSIAEAWCRTAAACLLLAAGSVVVAQDAPQLNLERVKLAAGMHRIDAQVAATEVQRQTGLMHRKEMPSMKE